jgi:hypothetical protein
MASSNSLAVSNYLNLNGTQPDYYANQCVSSHQTYNLLFYVHNSRTNPEASQDYWALQKFRANSEQLTLQLTNQTTSEFHLSMPFKFLYLFAQSGNQSWSKLPIIFPSNLYVRIWSDQTWQSCNQIVLRKRLTLWKHNHYSHSSVHVWRPG